MTAAPRRIAVSGYLGLGNLGDEAIFAGLAATLRAAGLEPLALSADPRATAALHGVASLHRLRGLPLAIARSTALVSGGGGLLQDVTSGRSLRYYLEVIRWFRAAGRPVVLYGQSLGPLSLAGRAAVARRLTGLPLLLRDAPSLDLARELGLQAQRVEDAALLLPERTPTAPGAAPALPPGTLLLIPRADVPGATAALAAVAHDAARRGAPFATLALQTGPDERTAGELASLGAGGVPLQTRDPYQAAAWISSAERVVSVRLHGLILAARAGTAHVGIGYDPKVTGFAATTGAEVVPVPPDPDATVRAARRAAAMTDAARQALLSRAEDGARALLASLPPAHPPAPPAG